MSGRGGGSIITAGAEAAKRARLERIVSSLKQAVVADDPEIRLCLEAKKCFTARRRIRSEICRSALRPRRCDNLPNNSAAAKRSRLERIVRHHALTGHDLQFDSTTLVHHGSYSRAVLLI